MKIDDKEARFFKIEARDDEVPVAGKPDNDYVEVAGKAVTFNEDTVIFSGPDSGFEWRERILPEAFAETDMSDVVFDLNHDTSHLFSRSRKHTLDITVKPDGVYFNARMWKDDAMAMETYKKIKHGDYDHCSFLFTLGKNGRDRTWSDDGKTLNDVVRNVDKLYDVSVVTFPAYSDTSINARFADCLDKHRQELDSFKIEAKRNVIKRLCENVLNQGGKTK